MRHRNAAAVFLIAILWMMAGVMAGLGAASAADMYRGHGIAMHGDLKYPADFKKFDYVNSNAPKGGEVKLSAIGGFDNFNNFIVKGRSASGIGLIYDTLMVSSADEPFSMYGLIAKSVEMPTDRSWITFHLNPDARWHDGKPISVEDVIWTFDTLVSKGTPFYRFYYGNVAKAEKVGPRSVKFSFKPGKVNRELPLIIGQLSVLPKHYWKDRDFTKTTLEPPLGSGAYRVKSFEANRTVEYERVKDYWAARHPTHIGQYNFDTLRYEYYRDTTVALEAFKAGSYDFRRESSSKNWATAYDTPAVRDGMIQKVRLNHNRSTGMQGFAYNLRRDLFKDPQVRRALDYAFDFEWSNKTLFYGQYSRTGSYFENSELASTGLPKGDELAVLQEYQDRLPPDVFSKAYSNPKNDGSGNIRANLRIANKILREAGWRVDRKTRILTHEKTKKQMSFEVLLVSPLFERVALPFKKNLKRLGIDLRVRTVDTAQYQQRVQNFDFDLIVMSWGQSDSPGNEQRDFWGTTAADRVGSRNFTGLKNAVVDDIIEKLIAAPDRKSLVTYTRALDRVLLSQHIVIPHWHIPYDRVVHWNKFGRPAVTPKSGVQFMSWWVDRGKADGLQRRKSPPKAK
jgi:microcin C transport system substrate-binding protein